MIDDKIAANKFLESLDEDNRLDLLMHLAEEFGVRVLRNGVDVTYFIPTKPIGEQNEPN